jgi:hypothetical protein
MQAGDLTTLSTCEAYIPNYVSDNGGPNDVLCGRLITAASQFIANYLDRDLFSLGGQGFAKLSAVSSDAGGPYISFLAPLLQVPPVGTVITDLTTGATGTVVAPTSPSVNSVSKLYLLVTTGFNANDIVQAAFLSAYADTYNGRNTPAFPLRQWPIANVSAVSVYGVTQPASTGPNVPGYSADDRFIYMLWACFPAGARNITVNYTAGYPIVPGDLEQACVDLVGKKIRQREHIDQSSIGVMADHISYSQKDMDPNTALVLQRYERELAAWT